MPNLSRTKSILRAFINNNMDIPNYICTFLGSFNNGTFVIFMTIYVSYDTNRKFPLGHLNSFVPCKEKKKHSSRNNT